MVPGCAQVMDFLGAAAFSKAVQALDIQAGLETLIRNPQF